MKTSKKTLSVLLSLILALLTVACLGTVSFAADEIAAYGPCGDNMSWRYEKGVLTVSGQGILQQQVVQFPTDSMRLNEETGRFEIDTQVYNVRSFPWYPALEDQLAKKYGYDAYPALRNALTYGILNAKTYYTELYGVIRDIVVEEGVTSIQDGAFSVTLGIPYLPRTISLPASLMYLSNDAINSTLAQRIVIRNPNLAVGHSLRLTGFAGSVAPTVTQDDLLNVNAIALQHDATVAETLANVLLVLNAELAQRNQRILDAQALTNEKEKAAVLSEIQAQENEQIERSSRYFFTRSATADGTLKELYARLRQLTGLNAATFDSVDDLGTYTPAVFDEQDNLLTAAQFTFTAAFRAKLDEMAAAVTAAQNASAAATADAQTYFLGETPQGLTPAPWITVYGEDGSTAKTAARNSQVAFSSLSTFSPPEEKLEEEDAVSVGGFRGLLQRILDIIREMVQSIQNLFKSDFSF